jgi:hypothetical protein
MNKQLYIIDYESSQWCGGASHCVVWATDVDDAVDEASDYMEDEMRELFADEYNDEDEECDVNECAYSVNAVESFDETHEYWKFYMDTEQSQFFPLVNRND